MEMAIHSHCEIDRSTLVLFWSADLLHWQDVGFVDYTLALHRHFTYPSMILDGQDLVVVTRAAIGGHGINSCAPHLGPAISHCLSRERGRAGPASLGSANCVSLQYVLLALCPLPQSVCRIGNGTPWHADFTTITTRTRSPYTAFGTSAACTTGGRSAGVRDIHLLS